MKPTTLEVSSHKMESAKDPWERLRGSQLMRTFAPSLAALCAVFIGLLFGLSKYTRFPEDTTGQVEQYYQWFVDVNIMIFIGFGFLMTFIRRYSYGAVALNMLASAIMFVEALLCIGCTQQVIWGEKANRITIEIPLLIDCAFCAGSGMIAFGAVIGKCTPTQLIWMCVAQVPVYAINQHLVIHSFKALDMGGTLVIHLFGCYYGLAASWMLSRKQPMHGDDNPKNSSSYLNNIFSMVGTLFLWIYWPSFNGALASVPLHHEGEPTQELSNAQFLSVCNTLLSLLGATITTFATSALVLRGRIDMVHIQNSTLAGGVAMGAACTLNLTPGGALVVGMAAGVLSVCGFTFLMPYLDHKIGLGDTCGIHNLHGMPAILGGLVAGLAALGQNSDYLFYSTGRMQLGYQVLAMVVTLGIALTSGVIVGWLCTFINTARAPGLQSTELFDDGVWWVGVQMEPLSQAYISRDASTGRANANSSAHGVPTLGNPRVAIAVDTSAHKPHHDASKGMQSIHSAYGRYPTEAQFDAAFHPSDGASGSRSAHHAAHRDATNRSAI